MKPTSAQAEQAAELLGVDVFYLGVALRDQSAALVEKEGRRIRGFETPNFGEARRFLWAAEAADKAWSQLQEAQVEA